MNRKELNRRYARIGSLNQLRVEREKLSWRIEAQEEALKNEYGAIREMFTWNYISGAAVEMLSPVSSLLSTALSGARSIISMFRGRSGGRKGHICGR